MRERSSVVLVLFCVVALVVAATPWQAPASASVSASVVAGDDTTDQAPDAPALVGAVVGGRPSTLNPGVTRLELFGERGSRGLCTGVVVGRRHVLTAAHCMSFVDESGRVVDQIAGVNVFGGGVEFGDPGLAMIGAIGFDLHPDHDRVDLAVLEMGRDLPIEPVALWSPDDLPPGLGIQPVGALIVGWGLTSQDPDVFPNKLTEATTSILASLSCRLSWRSFDAANQVCTDGATPCSGDSGGPVLVDLGDGRPSLGGIVSYGARVCGQAPTVYTQVAPQIGWLRTVVPDLRTRPAPSSGAIVPIRGTDGYWLLDASGQTHEFGVPDLASARSGAVAMEATVTGLGAWVLDEHGAVTALGDAVHHGSLATWLVGGERAVSLAATPTGLGYWIVTNHGRVVSFGDASPVGNLLAVPLNGGVIDATATPTGKGLYLVAGDGGVFALGDAGFRGSMGGLPLNEPIVGLAVTPTNGGYWLVAADGGIFSFGDAQYRGSMGGTPLNRPAVGMVPYGDGYLIVAADGGVFVFSTLAFEGSLGDRPPAFPVVAVAPRPVT